jgi:hypothetical protein
MSKKIDVFAILPERSDLNEKGIDIIIGTGALTSPR